MAHLARTPLRWTAVLGTLLNDLAAQGAVHLFAAGQMALAHPVAREAFALEEEDAAAVPSEPRGRGGAARASADDGDLVIPTA